MCTSTDSPKPHYCCCPHIYEAVAASSLMGWNWAPFQSPLPGQPVSGKALQGKKPNLPLLFHHNEGMQEGNLSLNSPASSQCLKSCKVCSKLLVRFWIFKLQLLPRHFTTKFCLFVSSGGAHQCSFAIINAIIDEFNKYTHNNWGYYINYLNTFSLGWWAIQKTCLPLPPPFFLLGDACQHFN